MENNRSPNLTLQYQPNGKRDTSFPKEKMERAGLSERE
jgi:hypothetical protein